MGCSRSFVSICANENQESALRMLCEMVHLGPIHMLCLTCRSPPNINDATSMFGESAFRHFPNSEKHRIVRVRVCACVSVPTVVCEFIHIKIVTAAIIYYLPFEAFACPNMKCKGNRGGGDNAREGLGRYGLACPWMKSTREITLGTPCDSYRKPACLFLFGNRAGKWHFRKWRNQELDGNEYSGGGFSFVFYSIVRFI